MTDRIPYWGFPSPAQRRRDRTEVTHYGVPMSDETQALAKQIAAWADRQPMGSDFRKTLDEGDPVSALEILHPLFLGALQAAAGIDEHEAARAMSGYYAEGVDC